jgi:hypothetical protein
MIKCLAYTQLFSDKHKKDLKKRGCLCGVFKNRPLGMQRGAFGESVFARKSYKRQMSLLQRHGKSAQSAINSKGSGADSAEAVFPAAIRPLIFRRSSCILFAWKLSNKLKRICTFCDMPEWRNL